jgi:ribosome-associated protein
LAAKKAAKKTTGKATGKRTARKTAKRPVPADRQFALAAAAIARDRHCSDIVVLDLRKISPATNYFVIATSTSDRQARSVADEISEAGERYNYPRFGRAGYEQGRWILLDFVDVVVHLFNEEARSYYNLEMLWGDAERLELEEPSGR